jgi:hypothetical protein
MPLQRGRRPGADWAGRLDDPAFARHATAAMDARGTFLGPALAETVASLPVSSVLDVGGGSGSYACALADRMPGIHAAVLERPPADAAARALLAERGYARRVAVLPGDMFGGCGFEVHGTAPTAGDRPALIARKPGRVRRRVRHDRYRAGRAAVRERRLRSWKRGVPVTMDGVEDG